MTRTSLSFRFAGLEFHLIPESCNTQVYAYRNRWKGLGEMQSTPKFCSACILAPGGYDLKIKQQLNNVPGIWSPSRRRPSMLNDEFALVT